MRECLGWITNCANEQGCPQNWLELSVAEIPTSIECHVCRQRAALVATEDELHQHANGGQLSAFPVVPCAALSGTPAQLHTREPVKEEPRELRREPPREEPREHRREREPAREPARAPTPPPPPAPAPAPKARGWVVHLQNGEQIKIDKDTMVVGRSRTCDIVVPSAKVSRQHASVHRQDGDIYIEDLGSANGVWINGEKVTRAKIKPGDTFTISDETLRFEEK